MWPSVMPWFGERGDPRYILDLIKRVVTVSVRTVDIVAGLPSLEATIAGAEVAGSAVVQAGRER